MSCKNCHWFKDENPYEVMSNGKMYPCTNIGESGWEQVAKVVEAVAEVVEND